MQDKEKIVLSGETNAVPDADIQGDLIFVLNANDRDSSLNKTFLNYS